MADITKPSEEKIIEMELDSLKWELNMLYEKQDDLSVYIEQKMDVIKELEKDMSIINPNFDREEHPTFVRLEDIASGSISKTKH